MFCGCATAFGAACPTPSLPGGPRPARSAAGGQRESRASIAISLGLALGCSIAPSSRFARKNYFYPDLAKNYQISQYDEPIAFDGSVDVELEDGTTVTVRDRAGAHGRGCRQDHARRRLDRSHPGRRLLPRRLQPRRRAARRDRDEADLRRRQRAPEIAKAYVATLRDIVRSLGISDARMERGNLRCDANVSLRRARPASRPRSAPAPRRRTSTPCARSSAPCATRSSGRPRSSRPGGTITQETRHWHEDTGTTSPGRPKSDADDYRYFPEPDLLPVAPSRD